MKKRAMISTVASVMLAGAMCVGFAACGKGETDVRKEIDALTGEEVTEEIWNAALNAESELYNNFVIDVVQTHHDEYGTEIYSYHFIHADSQCRGWVIWDISAMANKDDSCYDYTKENCSEKVGDYKYKNEIYYNSLTDEFLQNVQGKWGNGERDGAFDSGVAYLGIMTEAISYSGNFADYTYNTEKKGYVLTTSEEGNEILVVAKFADGKLKSLQHKMTADEGFSEYLYYLTCGGQNVTRPKVG